MYLSQTFWVFEFKLFHIMPMPHQWFKNKWKTLRLIICITLLVQTIRVYKKNNYENIVYKNYSNSQINTDVNIIWTLNFGTNLSFKI